MSDATTTTDMTYRRLGSSGLTVSAVGLGGNNFGMRIDGESSRRVIDAAFDAGVTLIDTSDSYGNSEVILGEALKGRRDNVVLATKFGSHLHRGGVAKDFDARGSRRYIRQAVERSLTRLQTDWIDLYQLHYPDPATPIAETLGALSELVHEGKVRYIGSSNLTAWQVTDADWVARTAGLEHFVSAQNQYNLLERDAERELIPAVEHLGLGLLPYFPLASGMLTGKYRRGVEIPADSRVAAWGMQDKLTNARYDVIEALSAFAHARDTTLVGVAFGSLLSQPAVGSVIAGATTAEQVLANVAAASWTPTDDDRAEIDRITGVTTD